jgi:hypothetical protein
MYVPLKFEICETKNRKNLYYIQNSRHINTIKVSYPFNVGFLRDWITHNTSRSYFS